MVGDKVIDKSAADLLEEASEIPEEEQNEEANAGKEKEESKTEEVDIRHQEN